MRIKSFGINPGLANARPPGRAKFANAPPPGLTRRANASQEPGGGGGAGAQLEFTDVLQHFQQTCELYSSKAAFSIAFFPAVNHITITSNEP